MSNTKRKVFTFEESDLEWIDPLLIEWEKENEGKRRGELITHLMKEYQESLKPSKSEIILEKVQSDFKQLKNDFGSRTSTSKTRLKEVVGETKLKLNKVANKIAERSKQVVDEIHSQVESRKK